MSDAKRPPLAAWASWRSLGLGEVLGPRKARGAGLHRRTDPGASPKADLTADPKGPDAGPREDPAVAPKADPDAVPKADLASPAYCQGEGVRVAAPDWSAGRGGCLDRAARCAGSRRDPLSEGEGVGRGEGRRSRCLAQDEATPPCTSSTGAGPRDWRTCTRCIESVDSRRPLKAEHDLPHLDQIAFLERVSVDSSAVDLGPIGRP